MNFWKKKKEASRNEISYLLDYSIFFFFKQKYAYSFIVKSEFSSFFFLNIDKLIKYWTRDFEELFIKKLVRISNVTIYVQ